MKVWEVILPLFLIMEKKCKHDWYVDRMYEDMFFPQLYVIYKCSECYKEVWSVGSFIDEQDNVEINGL